MKTLHSLTLRYLMGCVATMLVGTLGAAPPVVKTVPWVASNPLVPHTALIGKPVTLKGTCDQAGPNLVYTWDFGDGSPIVSGTVTTANMYMLEASHTYAGAVNTIYTARLSVDNTVTGETASKAYYLQLLEKALDTEVNVAIDEGLWYLHKTQNRYQADGVSLGSWISGGNAALWAYSTSAANVNAFEVNGHLESGNPDNPYVETVQRGMRQLFAWLTPVAIGIQQPDNRQPDTNGNGIGLRVNQTNEYYQGGMFMDAIVASGTPTAVTTTGVTGVIGRTYQAIVQDMVDAYSWAQYDGLVSGLKAGGWRYAANQYPDNSACQWAAIGLIAAERNWGCTVPAWVKQWNIPWLSYTQALPLGAFGYTDPGYYPWGALATTPSGMVQMVLDEIGRGSGLAAPSWERAETFMRAHFGIGGGTSNDVLDYYYGLFSFVKALLYHNGDGGPITTLHSADGTLPDIDWYHAEVSAGAPVNGVARTLINDQNAAGYWYGHNVSSEQFYFETAWAIMMLHRTVFESGVPVAVAKAIPNPAIVGQVVTLDGSDSYHQDAAKHIVKWEWDLNASGTYVEGSPVVTTTFSSLANYPVRLRVTDDGSPAKTAVSTVTVIVSTPPLAPTADAGGPYHVCAAIANWYLDGRGSRNPDEGMHQPGNYPGDTIQEYAWDLDGDNVFNDAFGPTPDVKAFFTSNGMGVGAYLVSLRVTDSTSTSYPSSGSDDLTDIASGVVYVDEVCSCISLSALPVVKGVRLRWTPLPSANSYNVYRSQTSGGPYTWIQNVKGRTYDDIGPGPLNATYYYVVRPTALNGNEICQSDQAEAEPLHPGPIVTCVLSPLANTPNYYQIDATSQSFGHMQLELFVGDSATSQVVGPLAPGSTIFLKTHYRVQTSRPGTGLPAAYVTVKGDARIWAKDPLGQLSPVVVQK